MALLAGKGSALPLRRIGALCRGDVIALFYLHGIALPLIHVLAMLPRNLATLLLGTSKTVDGVTLSLVSSRALLASDILKQNM